MARAKTARRKSDVSLVDDAKPPAKKGTLQLSGDQIEAIARGASDTFQHIVGRETHEPRRQMGRAKTLLAGRTMAVGGDQTEKAETALFAAIFKVLLPFKTNGSD